MRVMSAPSYVAWNYNYACNFNCSHCYSRAPWYPKELSTPEYIRIANELADMGTFRVALGGGEPLLRKDHPDVICLLSNRGVETNLTTNGWFVTREVAENLARVGLTRLYISLDSSISEVHDRFRRMPGSYQRVVNAVRLSVQAGLQVSLSTVITKINYHDLKNIADLAAAEGVWGLEAKRFRPAGNGAAMRSVYTLSSEEDTKIFEDMHALHKRTDVRVSLVYGPEANYQSGQTKGCACGARSICLRPNGDVTPCAYSDVVLGNLRDTSLKQLWQSAPTLKHIRNAGGCQAIEEVRFPSNPRASKFSSRREALASARPN